MNLFLLRHGLAAERGTGKHPTDADRPLTGRGERKLRRVADALIAMELSFDRIFSSPYLRARQTAELIAHALKAAKILEFTDTLTPGGTSKEVVEFLDSLKPVPDRVLLVGHEPNMSDLISLLVAGESNLSVAMKKGGLCKLSADVLSPRRCASLEWLLTPKQMGLMA
jgi:phosphohistidine phosphatase